MDHTDLKASQARLAAAARARFDRRSADRAATFARIEQDGVLGAAGPDRTRLRAAHARGAPRGLEAISGSDDTDHVNFLGRGARAARAVCRLLYDGEPFGTGFLAAPGLLLTNNHVIPDADSARGFEAEFHYQLDTDGNPMRTRHFELAPERAFVTSPEDALDFTFVALNAAPGEVSHFGWLPLDSRTDKILEGEPIVIIQHPQGREKQVCLFHSELVDRVEQFLQYTTDTELGSSGSPAFNRHWQLVGLHHASRTTGNRRRGKAIVINEGIRVSAIVAALGAGAGLIGSAAPVLAAISDPTVVAYGRPATGAPPLVVTNAVNAPVVLEATPTRIRRRSANHYDGRAGYDPAFLGTGSLEVPLPGLPPWLAADTARLIDDPGAWELKYTHFSIVLCMSRRLAYFTATNIDGPTVQRLGRTDRDPDHPRSVALEPEAAADIWYFDPRVPESVQLGPKVYDETDFAFGHLTRRLDPVWGDGRTTRIANDDTFHMTNCAPQHKALNSGTWATLEDAVLDAACRDDCHRVSVFTGPVLHPTDPDVLGVAAPLAYWKVVGFVDGTRLRSMGFIQWQTALVDDIRNRLEGLDRLVRAQEWQVPVAEIARVTSLDFGPLVAADTFDRSVGTRVALTPDSIRVLFAPR